MTKPFVSLRNITFSKSTEVVFRDFSWEINVGQQWAIVGNVGSGKTTLAEALAGKYFIRLGEMIYHFLPDNALPEIALVTFKENSKVFNYANFYYQQRYHATEADESLTVRDFLLKFTADDQLVQEKAQSMGIAELLDLSVIKLSNGQTRKLLITKALLLNPQLLILDNPFLGLDKNFRKQLTSMINLLANSGMQIVLVTQPYEIPDCISHVLELEDFAIKSMGSKNEYLQNLESDKSNRIIAMPDTLPVHNVDFEVAVKLEKVKVNYNGKSILENINWEIRKGEKWALLGHNGSGKTTLLSLIYGDNPQAYANSIWLFDKKRGTGESIWDVKQKIGFVSPELHLYFSENLTARQVIATGFFDTLHLSREVTAVQWAVIDSFLGFYEIDKLADRYFLRLSAGQQRVVLIIRALVKNPALLIMDEPFQNLDDESIRKTISFLNDKLSDEQTLIFVSHYDAEIPDCVARYLYLSEGKIAEISK
jgi:molybdate transport system ATP-binding protein